ncbi:MAG: type I glyceraldehyde-3-phosphate dehydrogenase [Flavobacteriales bacterium]
MKTRIAINGFGRIGRTLLRVLTSCDDIDVVAINDLADVETMAHLFKYDSVHGKFFGEVEAKDDLLIVNGREIRFLRHREAATLPWNELNVDIVIESTGTFKSLEDCTQHLSAGARRVILSAPPEDERIKTIVIGVNEKEITPEDFVISNASCTTNSAAHMIQLLDEICGIESCYITTVHSYTGDQRLHDAPHRDLRRARAAAESIVPTSTGAAKALTRIFPNLADKLGGCGIRVPVPDGSLTDITAIVRNKKSIDEINNAFNKAASDRWFGILEYTEDPIVSVDIIDNPASCVFDAKLTSVVGDMIKVVGWYDNEFGYSNRLVDLIRIVRQG